MKTFSMFISEDAGAIFRAMSDDQFENWKKNNPGASVKADKLRGTKPEKGGALAKRGSTPAAGSPKELIANKAKEIAANQAKKLASKAGGALVSKAKAEIAKKTSQVEKGKWAQGIKNAPKKAGDLVPSAQKSASGSAGEPELKGQQAKDAKAKEDAGKYRLTKDDITGALRDYDKEKEERKKAKKDEKDNMTIKQRMKDRFDHSFFGKKGGKKRGDAIYDAPGKLASFIARNMRSTVKDGGGPVYGRELSGPQQRQL